MKPEALSLESVPPAPTPEQICADGAMTVPQATQFTGLGRSRLYQLIADGRLHRIRIGGRMLLARRELIGLLASGLEGVRTQPSGSDDGRRVA